MCGSRGRKSFTVLLPLTHTRCVYVYYTVLPPLTRTSSFEHYCPLDRMYVKTVREPGEISSRYARSPEWGLITLDSNQQEYLFRKHIVPFTRIPLLRWSVTYIRRNIAARGVRRRPAKLRT